MRESENVPDPDQTQSLQNIWETVRAIQEDVAAEYSSKGFETIQVQPGDISLSARGTDEVVFDILVPASEHETLLEQFATAETVEYEVYRNTEEDQPFFLVVLQSGDYCAVVPLHYTFDERSKLQSDAGEKTATVRFRRLASESEPLDVTIDDASVFR